MSGLAYLQQKLITINTVHVNCDPQAKVKGGLRRSVQDTKKTSLLIIGLFLHGIMQYLI